MSATRDYISYLNNQIDMAPAGSEEELQAAQVIESLMAQHGVDTQIQEFETSSAGNLGRMIALIILFVGAVLAGILDTVVSWVGIAVVIVAFLLTALANAGHDLFSLIAPRAASQNVVGYHPATGPLVQKGNRKIVIVAHYDTPRENFMYGPQMGRWLPLFRRVSWYLACGVLALSILQAIAIIPAPARHVFWVLGVVMSLPLLLLGASAVYERFAACTEGANDNKTAVAAMLGVLDQVNPGSDSAKEWADANRTDLDDGQSRSPQSAVSDPQVRDQDDQGADVELGAYYDADDAAAPLEGEAYDEEGAVPEGDAYPEDEYADEAYPEDEYQEDGYPEDELSEDDEEGDEYGPYDEYEDGYDEEPYDEPDDVWSEAGWEDGEEDFEDGASGGFSLGNLFKGVKLPFGKHDDGFEAEPAFDDDPLATPSLGARADLAPTFETPVSDDIEPEGDQVEEDSGDEAPVSGPAVEAEVGEVSDSVMSLPVIGPDGNLIEHDEEPLEEPEDLYTDPDGLELPPTARHGVDTLTKLQLMPDTCEIVYRDLSTRAEVLERRERESVEESPAYVSDEETYDDFKYEYDEEPRALLDRVKSFFARIAQSIRDFFQGLRVRLGGKMDSTDSFEALTDEDYLLGDADDDWADDEDMAAVDDLQASAATARGMYVPDGAGYEDEPGLAYEDELDAPYEDERLEDVYDDAYPEQDVLTNDAEAELPIDDGDAAEPGAEDVTEDQADGAGNTNGTAVPEDHQGVPAGVEAVSDEADGKEVAEAVADDLDTADAEGAQAVAEAVVEPVLDGADVSQDESVESTEAESGADEPMAPVDAVESSGLSESESVVDPLSQVAQDMRALRFSTEKDVDDDELASKDISGLSTYSTDTAADIARTGSDLRQQAARPASVDDPTWGTSTYRPTVQGVSKRASLMDLPDPSASIPAQEPSRQTEERADGRKERLSSLPSPLDSIPDPATDATVDDEVSHDAVSVVDERSASARRAQRKASRKTSRRKGGRRSDEAKEGSLSDWLGLDDDYDAKKDGRAIGTWDNFDDDSTTWKGGGTYRSQLRDDDDANLPSAEELFGDVEERGYELGDQPDGYDGYERDDSFDARDDAYASEDGDVREDVDVIDVESQEELREAILRMGDELDSHDIWFVALGASQLDHAGMRAFIDENRAKVRGSFVINMHAVGAGNLTMITKEGPNAKRKSDRRLGRLVSRVADDLHIRLAHMDYAWDDTDATYAVNKAMRTTTLMGLSEDYLPALSHTQQDTARNIFPAQVVDVVHLVTELIRRS